MVIGIEKFREKFRDFTDCYTVIGGTACDILIGEADSHIIPIHIDDDISSLSAILLDEDFYEFMLRGRRVVADTSVLGAEYLIPFKMYAWLNLRTQKAAGGRVNDRDLKKHKNDIFRLLQIVSIGTVVPTTGKVHESIEQFLADIQDEDLHPEQLHLGFSKEEGISLLKQIYMV